MNKGGAEKVSELARCCTVTADAVRHYTDKGLLRPERDSSNGYKLYRAADIARVSSIHRAKQLDFTLTEIGQILVQADKGRSPCPDVRNIVQAKTEQNRHNLQALAALQARMESAVARYARATARRRLHLLFDRIGGGNCRRGLDHGVAHRF